MQNLPEGAVYKCSREQSDGEWRLKNGVYFDFFFFFFFFLKFVVKINLINRLPYNYIGTVVS